MFTANSTDDIAIRTVSQAPVKLLDTNFYELAGGQTIHFLSEVFLKYLFSAWQIIELKPMISSNEQGKVLKYFWKCIARKM